MIPDMTSILILVGMKIVVQFSYDLRYDSATSSLYLRVCLY